MKINSFNNKVSFKSTANNPKIPDEACPIENHEEKHVPTELDSLFRVIPKVELHNHLGGAYPLPVIRTMLKKQGLTDDDVSKKTATQKSYENLADFIALYTNVVSTVKNPEDLKKATYEVCMQNANNNVKYLELKISNQELDPDRTGKLSEKEIRYKAINEGIKTARKDLGESGSGIIVRLQYTAERHESSQKSLEDAKLAAKWAAEPESLLVGFDLAGDELNHSIEKHSDAIKYAKSHGLHLSIHAGETVRSENLSDVESMHKALDIGAERIGHGLAIFKDPELLKEIKKKEITIESSPTSNAAILLMPLKSHPIRKMLDENVKVTLCTDDSGIFETDNTQDLKKLYKNGVITDWKDIKALVINGINAAFVPKNEKTTLKKEVEDSFKKIEKTPSFKNTIDKYLTPAKEQIAFAGNKIASRIKQN